MILSPACSPACSAGMPEITFPITGLLDTVLYPETKITPAKMKNASKTLNEAPARTTADLAQTDLLENDLGFP